MKKRLFFATVIVICLSLLTSGTLAYFTTADTARNVITTGGVDIEIVEQQLVGDQLKPFPDEPIRVMPATSVSKIVTVKSLEQTAWIRAKYTVTVYDPNKKVMDIPEEELNRVIVIEPDSKNWTYKNGWWYCNTAVGAGKETAPLFETVAFSSPDMDNKYQLCTVTVDVNAQAVQKANNGTTVQEANGWSEN